jgi:hypoxanthine phosphoribosyltransferase
LQLDLDSAIDEFLAKNAVDDSEEEYVKDFKKKVEQFLGQSQISESTDVGQLLLRMLSDYHYYSRSNIEKIFTHFYGYLAKRVREPYTIYSPISSEKDVTRMNSSYFYLQKFLEINGLSNDQAINLSCLYLEASNKQLSKKVSYYEEKREALTQQEKEIQRTYNKLKYMETIVFIDDFSGTGRTIRSFLKTAAEMVKNKQVIVFVIHITEKAKQTINQAFTQFGYTNAFLKYEKHSNGYFEKNKELVDERVKLMRFEKEILKSKHPLGFEESEALVTFYRNCPNNTISSYWWDENSEWQALFQRKNKVLDLFGNRKHKEIYEAILYNISLIVPESYLKNYELKEVLYLLYLKEFPYDNEDFEIMKILGYNNHQLSEHRNQLLSEDWIDNLGNLSPKGNSVLAELGLKDSVFSELTAPKSLAAGPDSLSFDDEYIPTRLL